MGIPDAESSPLQAGVLRSLCWIALDQFRTHRLASAWA